MNFKEFDLLFPRPDTGGTACSDMQKNLDHFVFVIRGVTLCQMKVGHRVEWLHLSPLLHQLKSRRASKKLGNNDLCCLNGFIHWVWSWIRPHLGSFSRSILPVSVCGEGSVTAKEGRKLLPHVSTTSFGFVAPVPFLIGLIYTW